MRTQTLSLTRLWADSPEHLSNQTWLLDICVHLCIIQFYWDRILLNQLNRPSQPHYVITLDIWSGSSLPPIPQVMPEHLSCLQQESCQLVYLWWLPLSNCLSLTPPCFFALNLHLSLLHLEWAWSFFLTAKPPHWVETLLNKVFLPIFNNHHK